MVGTFEYFLEIAATLFYAISGVRLAAVKKFDWFGAYTIGFVTAIGGGTMRDVFLKCNPFWMLDPWYCVATFVYAQHQGIGFCLAFEIHLAQHVHHKIHCSEVVVVHFHPVHIGFLNPNLAPFAHFFVGFCHWL